MSLPIIIIGSGPSATIAALTLMESGRKVLMLDAGFTEEKKITVPDQGSFLSLRHTDHNQHQYFLGTSFFSRTGAQVVPGRMYMTKETEKYIPLATRDFFPMESLAFGGLGVGWGLGTCVYSEAELKRCGLPFPAMRSAYQWVADRIGISGAKDDASEFTRGELKDIQEPVLMDMIGESLFDKYQKKREALSRDGFYLGRTALALLTRDKDHRKKHEERELEYYSDRSGSMWRPAVILEPLIKSGKLDYRGGHIVQRFEEREEEVQILGVTTDGKAFNISGERVILATGTLGTARIVLNSSGNVGDELSFLCNPYFYIPAIQRKLLGSAAPEHMFGYSQLSLFHDPTGLREEISMASIYSYRQLMYHRLLMNAPFDLRTNFRLFRALLPSLTIFGIHHPVSQANVKMRRLSSGFEAVVISEDPCRERNAAFRRAMRILGCFPVRTVNPGLGASIHYAGSLPFSEEPRPLSLHPEGRLHNTKHVFVADGSGFRFLPAKGLTFSLMANAHIVATNLLRHLS